MAHQAVDLGHGREALQLAESSLEMVTRACHASGHRTIHDLDRADHAATSAAGQTLTAISSVEQLLSTAQPDGEPIWIQTNGFTETSLASQAGQVLRDLGDLAGAEDQFRISIATRNADEYRRIHTLTLANLAEVQCAQVRLGEANANWNLVLDTRMTGVKSARARAAVENIRHRLSSFGPRQPAFAKRLDQRAAAAVLRGPR